MFSETMPIVANAASTNIRNKAISKPTNARSIPGRSLFTSADTTPNVTRKTETLHLQRSNHSTSLSNNGVESATKRRRIDAIILCQGPSGNIAIRERILIFKSRTLKLVANTRRVIAMEIAGQEATKVYLLDALKVVLATLQQSLQAS